MTVRAVILGLLGAALIAGLGYYNDEVLSLNLLVGNHFPISVFGLLFVGMIAINPLLYLLRRSWRFSAGELAVMLVCILTACSIPGSGLMRTFVTSLAMPITRVSDETAWKKTGILSYVPAQLLPNEGVNDEETIGVLKSGKATGGEWIDPVEDVPWGAWSEPLSWWVPLVLLCMLGVIGLSLVVHRQWSSGERLRYPIADVTSLIIRSEPESAFAPIFRQRLFWIGLAAILAIRVVNGLHEWYEDMILIDTVFDFDAVIINAWPKMSNLAQRWSVTSLRLYFTVIGFAYFLASDVGLSLGISKMAWLAFSGVMFAYNVDIGGGGYFEGGPGAWMTFGAYFGVGLMLVYTGRSYYWRVIRSAFFFRRDDQLERASVWGARAFAVCSAGMVALLYMLGLDILLGVLTVALTFLLFLVMARISAETGLFFIQSSWQAFAIIVALFGAAALGPKVMITIGLVASILSMDPRECLMPFLVNAYKVCDDNHVRPGRAGWSSAAAIVLAVAVAIPVVIYISYDSGVPAEGKDDWARTDVPGFPYETAAKYTDTLHIKGELDKSLEVSGFGRLSSEVFQPDRRFLWSAGAGLVLVLVCSFARLRFAWWPIHPVLFLVWFPNPLNHFAWSFFLGWIIKSLVTRLGGVRAYQRGKALMVGIIAGDLLGGLTFMAVSLIHKIALGTDPKVYKILPI